MSETKGSGDEARTVLRAGVGALFAALLLTMGLGVWMRWGLAGFGPTIDDFDNLRHAHSHLGYYGALFPLAWLGWRASGVPLPSRRVLWIYAAAVLISFVGFADDGYGAVGIAGSTAVGLLWLYTSWPLLRRLRDRTDPLGLVFPGVVLAQAYIPFIATSLRTDPAVAQAYVATFLATLLFLVMVPSALAAIRRDVPAWALFVTGAAGALFLGAWSHLATGIGLAAFGASLGWVMWGTKSTNLSEEPTPLWLRVAWAGLAAGSLAMAVGVVPNVRPVVIGAIHFAILGPVLGSFCFPLLGETIPPLAWWIGLLAVAILTVPLVVQGLGGGPWTSTASASGGTLVAMWWAGALTTLVRREGFSRPQT